MVDGGGKWGRVGRSGGRVRWSGPGERRCPMFFMGTYTPKLDDKGRLFLPAKFRDQLAEGLVVTRGQERCLTVWPQAAFERGGPAGAGGTGHRSRRPATTSGCSSPAPPTRQPDKQGRITIPPMLREYASLSKDVVVIGVDEPGRDLGPGRVAGVLRRPASRRSPSSATRSSPGSDPDQHQQHRSTHHNCNRRHRTDEVSGPLPDAIWGTFPGARRRTSHPGSGQGPGRANPHTAAPASTAASVGSRPMSITPPRRHRRPDARRGAPPGPRRRRRDGVLRGHLGRRSPSACCSSRAWAARR